MRLKPSEILEMPIHLFAGGHSLEGQKLTKFISKPVPLPWSRSSYNRSERTSTTGPFSLRPPSEARPLLGILRGSAVLRHPGHLATAPSNTCTWAARHMARLYSQKSFHQEQMPREAVQGEDSIRDSRKTCRRLQQMAHIGPLARPPPPPATKGRDRVVPLTEKAYSHPSLIFLPGTEASGFCMP